MDALKEPLNMPEETQKEETPIDDTQDIDKFSDTMPSVRPTVGYRPAESTRIAKSRLTSRRGGRLVAKDYALSPRSSLGAMPMDNKVEMAMMDRKIHEGKARVRAMEAQYDHMLQKEVEMEMIKRQMERERREREQREREARIAAEIVRQREERERQRRIAAELERERRRQEREREERIAREIERQRIRRQLQREEQERKRREREARIAAELERARIVAKIAREEEERERAARAARHNVDSLKDQMIRDINSRLALGEKTWTIPMQFSTPSEHELYIDLLQGRVESREAAPYKVTVTEKYERL